MMSPARHQDHRVSDATCRLCPGIRRRPSSPFDKRSAVVPASDGYPEVQAALPSCLPPPTRCPVPRKNVIHGYDKKGRLAAAVSRYAPGQN